MHQATLTRDARFTHLVTSADLSVLVGDDDFVLIEEKVVAEVVRLVDGVRTASDVVAALGSHAPETVHYVLIALEQDGIVTSGVDDRGRVEAAASSETTRCAERLLRAWTRGDGQSPPVLPLVLTGLRCDLILAEDYLCPRVAETTSRIHRESGRPVLLTRLGARSVWIGPLVRPEGVPCIACLQDRLRLNMVARTLLYGGSDGAGPGYRVEPLGRTIPVGAFELLAEGLVESSLEACAGNVRVLATDGTRATDHVAPVLPQCTFCGDPTLHPPGADVRLEARVRVAGSSSGYRTVTPAETLRRVESHVDPLTGIVRAVARVRTDGSGAVHVYSANHAQHHGTASLTDLREEARDHSGGKGSTNLEAKVSAICEALERSSSVYRGTEAVRVATLSQLGPEALAPNALMHFSEEQLRRRDEWNAAHGGGFQWIPNPYGDEPIAWSPARSLTSGEIRWVPSAHVYYGFKGEGVRFADGDSNGLAGGNCVEEAVLQGLLELVERDAVALWWYNRARRPPMPADWRAGEWARSVEDYYEGCGRELWVLDLTTDVGIPVAAAISARDGREIVFGFGAHLDPSIAVRRALAETSQMLASFVGSSHRHGRRSLAAAFPDAVAWFEGATTDAEPYLRPAHGRRPVPPFHHAIGVGQSWDLRDDLLRCIAAVAAVGCDVLVHDLTRPDIAFPVVKVIAPGLRHFWRRLGPGRLYDVPVRLGWLREPRREDDMNPVSMFV